MGLHWTQLPTKFSGRGTATGPTHSTGLVTNDAMVEDQRFQRLDQARRTFQLTADARSLADLSELQEFVIARWGAAHSFLYQDESDFTTADDGTTTPTAGDTSTTPTIGVGDGARREWQMVKVYGTSPNQVRHIRAAAPGTVVVTVNSVLQTEGTDYVVDYTLGRILFATAPTNTHVIRAGCAFYCITRFGEDVDGGLSLGQSDYDSGPTSFGLVEDAVIQDFPEVDLQNQQDPPTVSGLSDRISCGGGTDMSAVGVTGTVDINFHHGRAVWFNSLTGTVTAQLPDIDAGGSSGHANIVDFSAGGVVPGHYFTVINDSPTYTVNLHDWNGSAWAVLDPIYAIGPGVTREVFIDAAGIWRAR